MSEQKPRMPYFADNMVHHYEDDTEPNLHPHLFTQYIEKSAFDKAVEALKWIKTDVLFDRLEDPIVRKIDETLKDLGESNG
ncbi:hypothetical protein [Bdellovibrio sp. HCB288]|uniref:hypothetical protein n=1 Tax=Bdellovibrio sp. HCB288 TaxID=3394355 RepID=UPI0039B57ADE